MENQEGSNTGYQDNVSRYDKGRDRSADYRQRFGRERSGRAFGGMVVIIVGTLLLARQVGADLPGWIFSWPMILIAVGIFIGVRHRFRNLGFLIPLAIGIVFLMEDALPEIGLKQYLWPAMIIGVGLTMLLRSRRGHENDSLFDALKSRSSNTESPNSVLDSVTIFGENKHKILSKDFKGGESVAIFGGAEINLMQADIQGRVPLELVMVFGGTKLIVPSHWKIETEEVVSIFGGLNDKRQFQNVPTDETKVLVLRGTTIFGGIDIKSF